MGYSYIFPVSQNYDFWFLLPSYLSQLFYDEPTTPGLCLLCLILLYLPLLLCIPLLNWYIHPIWQECLPRLSSIYICIQVLPSLFCRPNYRFLQGVLEWFIGSVLICYAFDHWFVGFYPIIIQTFIFHVAHIFPVLSSPSLKSTTPILIFLLFFSICQSVSFLVLYKFCRSYFCYFFRGWLWDFYISCSFSGSLCISHCFYIPLLHLYLTLVFHLFVLSVAGASALFGVVPNSEVICTSKIISLWFHIT